MSILESPLVIAISPVLVSSLVTIYATRKNKQINPSEHNDLIRELRKENAELRKNGKIKS